MISFTLKGLLTRKLRTALTAIAIVLGVATVSGTFVLTDSIDKAFDSIFTEDRPIVFAYHGYPWLIHRLTYRRRNHDNLHVRGYKEEGTTTTPFDMAMLNDLDRYHLVIDVIDRVPGVTSHAAHLRQEMVDRRLQARAYTRAHGEDDPEIRDWTWPY